MIPFKVNFGTDKASRNDEAHLEIVVQSLGPQWNELFNHEDGERIEIVFQTQ
jgi:hypothetical protein